MSFLTQITTLTKTIKKLEKTSEKIDHKIRKLEKAKVKPVLKFLLRNAPPGKNYDAERYRSTIQDMLKDPGKFHIFEHTGFEKYQRVLDDWNLTLAKQMDDDGDEYNFASVKHYYIREWVD